MCDFYFYFLIWKPKKLKDNFEDEAETGKSLDSDLLFIVSQVKRDGIIKVGRCNGHKSSLT